LILETSKQDLNINMIAHRPLFDARVLKRELEKYKKQRITPPIHHLETLRSWHDKISNGLLDRYSETQVEQAFNSAIFVDILEYKPLGSVSDTVHIIPKRSTGRAIPDFVLGSFNSGAKIERWRAVGEIKDLHTNLDLPQTSRYHRETPVQQAFRYALEGKPGVEWVVVTNFREIRLYRNGFMAAFHQWKIEDLCQEERFTEFWLLLRQPHLAPEVGESETLRILNTSISAGLALTEGFYGLYDLARRHLLNELRKQPATRDLDATTLYGKAHKLLNRILFAAFCEDHPAQLLPENTLKSLHDIAGRSKRADAYWATFQNFFRELDKGSPPGSPNGFNAFNGGLFAADQALDSVILPSRLFTEPLTFKAKGKESRRIEGVFGFHVYDFSEELDVDSLGTIFEQSLKDLPTKSRSLRGHGETDLTRREITGVYYTPPAITGYLVSRALDFFLGPIREELVKEVDAMKINVKKSKTSLSAEETRDVFFLQKFMDRLETVALIDPACGSGAFLIEAFQQLHAEYETLNSALGQLKGAQPMFGLDRMILRNNLHGIDVLGESAEITKLSLWLRTASRTEPLEKLDKNIRCADTFRVKDGATFDIIVSNPPWGAELDGWSEQEIKEKFPQCGSEKDSAAIFVMKAWEFMAPGGVLAFVLPNSWLTVDSYEPFRRWLLEKFELLELVNVWKIFRDVNHDVCLLIVRKPALKKGGSVRTYVRALERGISEDEKNQALAEERWAWSFEVDPSTWIKEPSARFETIYSPKIASELTRVSKNSKPLGELFDVTVGIQVYHQRNVSKEIIQTRAFHADHRKGANWYPCITGNEVQRYFSVPKDNAYVLYSEALCDKRELRHYELPRVLVQQIFWNRLSASLESPSEPFLYLNTLFSVTQPKSKLGLGGVVAILNSRFVSAAYERWANRLFGDKFPKVSKLDLARLPIPSIGTADAAKINSLGEQLQNDWSDLKRLADGFRDYLQIVDPSGELLRALKRFWIFDKKDITHIVGRSLVSGNPSKAESIVKRWVDARNGLNGVWSRIISAESNVEDLVNWAYGVKPDFHLELIARAPAPSLDDILLPKT
jgi:hypothetical protein